MTSVNWFIGHIIVKDLRLIDLYKYQTFQQRSKVFSEVAFLFVKHNYIFCMAQNAKVAVNFFHGRRLRKKNKIDGNPIPKLTTFKRL